jgi:phosphatidate cytidylyltransferase
MNAGAVNLTLYLVGGVLALLAVATGFGQVLKRQTSSNINPEVVRLFQLRLRTWWFMCSLLALTFLVGRAATVVMFGAVSFWALREFVTLTPTRPGDHRALFWVFFIFTPLQFLLVGMELPDLYTVLIPVYGFLFIPARAAFSGDFKRFLERAAKIQSGLMICVYCLSHAPAILSLRFDPAQQAPPDYEANSRLLFFFVLVVQMGDVFCYFWGKLLGKHVIAPAINPDKTWEGFLGGVGSATLLGAALYWATPFDPAWAAGMSMLITVTGFAGGMTLSAIKRDRGVRDYGTLVVGHGGVLDRIDSICFAAPVFYHAVRAYVEFVQ